MTPAWTDAWVRGMRIEAEDVIALELARADGQTWAPAAAGAHVDLEIPGIGPRSYSLLPPAAPEQLCLGVLREPQGRGGSRWIHEQLRPGQAVRVSAARNHFALDGGPGPVRLIAGGIGITPIAAMAHALAGGHRDWRLHYAVRTRRRAAFLAPLAAHGQRLQLHVDDEAGGPLDLRRIVDDAPAGTHFYCCGPAPMMDAFASATATLDPQQVHVEHFAAPAAAAAQAPTGSFEIELARSGRRLAVPADRSILDVLLAQGIAVAHSCRSGICGSCETAVLQGTPEHRDLVLSPQERASGKTLLVCCSRAAGERLVLDL